MHTVGNSQDVQDVHVEYVRTSDDQESVMTSGGTCERTSEAAIGRTSEGTRWGNECGDDWGYVWWE